jgi:glycosyltransferase involved in cell wall biosynthesis
MAQCAIHRSDLVFCTSPFEMRLLQNCFGISSAKLHLASFFYKRSGGPTTSTFNSERRVNFVTIGNWRHAPNVDSVRWLKEAVWPRVVERLAAIDPLAPRPECHVWGAMPLKEHMAWTDPASGFLVKGPCKDQHAVLSRYRVLLAPLRFGAGLKGKIADAWSVGTPVVTTSVGAEGMCGWDCEPHEEQSFSAGNPQLCSGPGSADASAASRPFAGRVADSADELASAAAALYTDSDAWQTCSAGGKRLVRALYDAALNQSALVAAVSRARAQLEGRRRVDWISGLLWSSKDRSTELLAKFIALKKDSKGDSG